MYKHIFSLIFLFLDTGIAIAQDDAIDTDRPDQTESAVTINKKWIHIEHGFNVETDNSSSVIGSSTLFRYGLLQNFELRLEADLIYTPSTSDFPSATELQPISLGTKISLWPQKKVLPKTSLLMHFGLPFLASRSFKNFNAQPSVKLTFQNNLSEKFSLGYNAGAEWDGENSTPAYIYTFSLGLNLSQKLYSFFEVYGSFKKYELPQHNFDTGLSWLINNNFKADVSSSIALSKAAPDWAIAIGASVRFATFKNRSGLLATILLSK